MAYIPKPAMDDITDVDATGISNGQTLVYTSGEYKPGQAGVEEVAVRPDQPVKMEDLWVDLDAPDPGGGGGAASLRYVNVTGDNMSGPLSVLTPETDGNAANKAYVDGGDVAVTEYADIQDQGVKDYANQIVTVSTEDPVAPPARDGLLWIKVEA